MKIDGKFIAIIFRCSHIGGHNIAGEVEEQRPYTRHGTEYTLCIGHNHALALEEVGLRGIVGTGSRSRNAFSVFGKRLNTRGSVDVESLGRRVYIHTHTVALSRRLCHCSRSASECCQEKNMSKFHEEFYFN